MCVLFGRRRQFGRDLRAGARSRPAAGRPARHRHRRLSGALLLPVPPRRRRQARRGDQQLHLVADQDHRQPPGNRQVVDDRALFVQGRRLRLRHADQPAHGREQPVRLGCRLLCSLALSNRRLAAWRTRLRLGAYPTGYKATYTPKIAIHCTSNGSHTKCLK